MAGSSRIIQVVFLVLAVGLVFLAGRLQEPIVQQSTDAKLITQASAGAMKRSPELGLLMALPGGLRVLGVNLLWIRSQNLHQAGRHYDALQMAELICKLQPYYPGVWAFQAWNMAWNISVTCQSPQQRWRWVYNGVKLLRDRAIVYNPRSLVLYKELSWIFFSKMGGMLDDQHLSYKERWAGMMQALLGAPPVDNSLAKTLEQKTKQAIDAFRIIAQAPLDKTPQRQGREIIQPDQLANLLGDPAMAHLAKALARFGIGVDESLLRAYNKFSMDYAASCVRTGPPTIDSPEQKALFKLINDPSQAQARAKMLAFVRAQILWNTYRMDPSFMLELMKKYNIPLDWRHTMAHGLYWAQRGLAVAKVEDPRGLVSLNNARNVLNSLKTLTATGLVTMQNRPGRPNYPAYYESADLRYIEPTNQQHLAFIEEIRKSQLQKGQAKPFEKNILATGHVNYLVECIQYLLADGRVAQAQKYFDFIRQKYKRKGPEWDFQLVEEFVLHNMLKDGSLRYVVALELMTTALKRAFISRGLYDNEAAYRRQMSLAGRIYKIYEAKAVDRMKLQGKFHQFAGNVFRGLLGRPRIFGLSLNLVQRSDIYLSMADQPEVQMPAYISLERLFKELCKAQHLDPAKAFPPPPGVAEYRKKQQREVIGQ
jgi:hypothetical protein